MCPHFQRGFCKRGQACNFKHIQPEHAGAVSKENKKKEVIRSESSSGFQGLPWQSESREAISLQDQMARESQAVPSASRKFTAPRPERHFQKGVKVNKLGSTILKGVSNTSQRVVDKGSTDRPQSSQPCVFAPPDTCKPVVPRVLVKQPRCKKAGIVLRHFAKPTGIKRRTQIPNAPGTRMRAVKSQSVPQLSPVPARVPWADLQDSDEDETPDSTSSSAEDMSTQPGIRVRGPLRAQRGFGDPALVDHPSDMFPKPYHQNVPTGINLQAAQPGSISRIMA